MKRAAISTDSRTFASLTSGLLARKGQARPAMRPQGFEAAPAAPATQDDLGWNDMGDDTASAPRPTVHDQQATIEREFNPPAEAVAEMPAATPAADAERAPKPRTAFTLRLDRDRHLRLRLACTLRRRSAQILITEALDAALSAMPEIERLATELPDPNKGS